MPLTGVRQHCALPTSSRLNTYSASSLSPVRYCLYSLNSFRVQTTYRETRAEIARALSSQLLAAGCLPRNSPNPAGGGLLLCTRSLCARGTPLRGNRFYRPDDVQTYLAIAGDKTPSLQPLQVVLAFVVGPEMGVVQAVVLCGQSATVGISQVKIA